MQTSSRLSSKRREENISSDAASEGDSSTTINEHPANSTTTDDICRSSPSNPTLRTMEQQQQQHVSRPVGTVEISSVTCDLEAQRVNANSSPAVAIPMVENNANSGGRPLLAKKHRRAVIQVIANFACVLIAGLIMEVIMRLSGPYRRGFFCTDDSIRLPYKNSLVPVGLLLTYCFGLTGLSIVLGEYFRLNNAQTCTEQIADCEKGEPLRFRLLVRWVFFHGYFLIVFVVTDVFTSMAKFPVGRLRPHFIDVCKPVMGNETETDFCKDPDNQHRYVDVNDYTCSNDVRPSLIAEARLSFFSGHSSLAMCAAVFTVIYLHDRISYLCRYLVVVPMLQMAILSSAMFIAYSRIQDNMHHWSDVLIGMITGSIVAAFVALKVVGLKLNAHRLNQFIPLPIGGDKDGGKFSVASTAMPDGLDTTAVN